MKKTTPRSFKKQSAVSIVCHIATLLFAFLSQIVIARVFGPEGRGIFANAYMLAGVLGLLLSSGHALTNAYFVASGKQRAFEAAGSSIIGLAMSVLLLSGFTFYVIHWRPPFVVLLSNSIILLAFAAIPIRLLGDQLNGILRGLGHADLAYMYYGIAGLSRLLSLVVFCLLLSWDRLETVFVAGLTGVSVGLLFALWFLRHYLAFSWLKPRPKAFVQSMGYSLKFFGGKISSPMEWQIDIIIIPLILSDVASLGNYAQGFAILNQMLLLPAVLGYVLMPRVAKNANESDYLTARVCRLVFAFSACMGIAILLLAKPVVPLVFGKDFSAAVPLMWIMLAGMVFRSVSKILYYHCQGAGMPMTITIVSFISLGAMLTIDIILIPIIGIKGAAIGTLCSCFVEFLIFSSIFLRNSGATLGQMLLVRRTDVQLLANTFRNLKHTVQIPDQTELP